MTFKAREYLKAAAIATGVAVCPLAFAPSALAANDEGGGYNRHVQGGGQRLQGGRERFNGGARMSQTGGERFKGPRMGEARGERFTGARMGEARGERFREGARMSGGFEGARLRNARVNERFNNGARWSDGYRGGYYRTGLAAPGARYGGNISTSDFRSSNYRAVGYRSGYYGDYRRNFVGYAPGYDNGYRTTNWDWGYPNYYGEYGYGDDGRNFVDVAPSVSVGVTSSDWGWNRPVYSTDYVGYSGCSCSAPTAGIYVAP